MTDVSPASTLDAARLYLARGWSPIPLAASTKWPPPNGVTGWRGRYTTTLDLTAKGFDWTGNIAIRLPPDIIGIDVDAYHGGTVEPLEALHGKLPATVWSTSRDDGSGIALFHVPVGTVLATDPAEGIDMIQAHHRYIVCAPSIHPDGRIYRWIDEADDMTVDGPPHPSDLPDLPWPWIEALTVDKTAGSNAATPDAAVTFVEAHTTRTKPGALEGIRSHLKTVRKGGRHDALVSTMCWAMREAAAGLYTADEAIATIHNWWIDAVSDQPHRRDNGEFGGTILWAIGQTGGDTERINQIRSSTDLSILIAPTNGHHPPANIDPTTGEILQPTVGLDDTFWNARPYLAHIHQAARSRLVAPHAVLGAVLARTAAFTPPSSCLPPIIGTTSPLSMYVALRGASGAGKSAPASTAADLIPNTPPGCVGPWALGTGEGLAEAFQELIDDPTDDSKKPRKIKRQVHHGALFTLDEGQVLAEIGSRKGATILPVLRTAWSGGDPGQANASLETRRSLKPGSYHVGLISLWQDFAAANLIADAPGGTPQRFIWFATNDPGATLITPKWPGPLQWEPPPYIVVAGSHAHHPLDVHPDVEHEVRMARVNVLNGTTLLADLDAHRRLAKLRVAALLAILDNRHDINPEDWDLAAQIIDTSDQIRDWIITENQRRAGDIEMSGHRRAATREIVVATEVERLALSGAAKAIAKRVHRDNGEPVGRRDISQAVAGKHRKIVSIDDAIEEAERLHWITPKGDLGWTPGEAKPT